MFSVGQNMKLFLTTTGVQEVSGNLCYVWAQTNFDGYAKVEDLMGQDHDREKRLSFDEIHQGDIVIAKYHVDDSWYRAQVHSKLPESKKVKIFFIDFGNSDDIDCSNIVKGHTSYFVTEPLATKFLLADIRAKDGRQWSSEEMGLLEQNLNNIEFDAEVIDVGSAGVPTTVRLYTSSGAKISEELISMGCGAPYENSHNKFQAIPPMKLSPLKKYHVYISFVASPMKFWVQLANFQDSINRVNNALIEYVQDGLPLLPVEQMQQGMPCVAKFDDAFFRGVIYGVDFVRKYCTIHFIDYGNMGEVEFCEIYRLPREEGFMHALCAECTCKGNAEFADLEACMESLNVYLDVLSALDSGSYVVTVSDSPHEKEAIPPRAITNQKPSSPANDQVSQKIPNSLPADSYSILTIDPSITYDVCISHVENNGTFYCQFVQNAPKLEDLMCHLTQAGSSPLSGTVEVGAPCIVRDPSEMVAYRGEILANNISVITVRLVDFGIVLPFKMESVFGIRPEYVVNLPSQARLCVLKGATSVDRQELIHLLKMYESKQALHCRVVRSSKDFLEVELYDILRNGTNILELNKESVQKSSLKSSLLNPSSSVFLPPAEISEKSDHVCAMSVVSDTEVFCQLTKYDQVKLDNFQADLLDHYTKNQIPTLNQPKIGDICCSIFTEDDGYYRAKVLQVKNNKADISFVDFGNVETKDLHELKELDPKFCNLPVQGILCCLRESVPGITKATLEDILNEEFHIEINRREGAKFHVSIPKRSENAQVLNILQRLNTSAQQVPIQAAKVQQQAPRPAAVNESIEAYNQLQIEKGTWEECFVSHVDNPETFYIQFDSQTNALNTLMDKLEAYCTSAGPDKIPGNVGIMVPVAAKYTEDSSWYRALITGILKSGEVEVFYVDYGNSAIVPRSDLRTLTPDLMTLPSQAIKCCLYRMFTKDSEVWTDEDIDEFKNLVIEAENCKVYIDSLVEAENLYYIELFKGVSNVNQLYLLPKNKLRKNVQGPGNPPDNLPFYPSKAAKSDSGPKFGAKPPVPDDGGWGEPAQASTGGFGQTSSGSGGSSGDGFGNRDKGGGFGSRGGEFGNSGGGFGNSGGGFGNSGGGFGNSGGNGFDSGNDRSFGSRDRGGRGGERGGFGGRGGDRFGGTGGKDSDSGSERSFGSRDRPRGGGGGFNRDEMLGMEVQRDKVGRIIGKGGSKIKEITESTGTKIRVLSKDSTGDLIPVEIYGDESGRERAKEIIEELVNANFGGPRQGGFSSGGDQGGFSKNSDRDGFSRGESGRGGGFGNNNNNRADDDWGDSNNKSNTRSGFGGAERGFGDRNQNRQSNNADNWDSGGGSSKGFGGDDRKGFGGGDRKGFGGSDRDNWREKDNRRDTPSDRGFGNKPRLNSFEQAAESVFGRMSSKEDTDWGSIGSNIKSPSTFVYKKIELPINGEYMDGYVTSHDSPSQFYCQFNRTYDQLKNLMAKMQEFYGGLGAPDMALLNFIKDRVCVAKFSEDNQWYRAKVISVPKGQVKVLFVDYGNSEEVTPEKIKDLKEEFVSIPAQAIECSLFGIKPKGNNWTDSAIDRFISLTGDQIVATATERLPGGKYIMDITANNQPVHEVLIKEGFGEDMHDDIPSVPARRTLSLGSTSSSTSSKHSDEKLKPIKLSSGDVLDVTVSHAENPGMFWIHCDRNMSQIDSLSDALYSQYENLEQEELSLETGLKIGKLCCAKWEADGNWYRSIIKEIGSSKVTVDFVDYGNQGSIDPKSIKQLKHDFMSLPTQGICCKLDGVVPISGNWSQAASNKFDDMLVDVQVRCQVNSNTSPYLVSLTIAKSGISVAEELIQFRFARPGRDSSGGQQLRSKEMAKGRSYIVGLSWMINPKEFYCQLAEEEQELCVLQERLSETYEQSRLNEDQVVNAKPGVYCVAYYPQDGNWYRGVIEEIMPPNSALVKYVDYGNSETVPQSKLKALHPEFTSKPCYAFKCELNMLDSLKGKWGPDAINMFKKFAEQRLKCSIVTASDDSNVVDLCDSNGNNLVEAIVDGGKNRSVRNDQSFGNNRPQREGFSENKSRGGFDNRSENQSNGTRSGGGGGFGGSVQSGSQFDGNRSGGGFNRNRATNDDFNANRGGSGFGTNQSRDSFGENNQRKGFGGGGGSDSFGENNQRKGFGGGGGGRNDNFSRNDGAGFGGGRKDGGFGGSKPNNDFKTGGGFGQKSGGGFGQQASSGFGSGGFSSDNQTADDWGEEAVPVIKPKKEIPITSATPTSTAATKKIVLPKQDVPSEQQEFYISNVTSPKEFYIQLVSKEDEINKMIETVTEEYDKLGSDEKMLCHAVLGQVCCAKFGEEGWYRANITNITGDNATVLFLDYGNSDTVPKSSLKILETKYHDKAPLAYKCKIDGFLKYTDEDTAKLDELSEEGTKTFMVKFVSTTVPYKVKLFDPSDLETNLATTLPSWESQPSSDELKTLPPVDIPTTDCTAYVSNIESPAQFYVQLQSQEDNLQSVSDLLESFKSSGDKLDDPVEGCLCGALFSEDENWYRGKVTTINDDKAEIVFVDYGNGETINVGSLKSLTDELLNKPPFAIKCSLEGINADDCTDKLFNSFSEWTLEKELKVTFVTQSEPCIVRIMDGDVNVNENLIALLKPAASKNKADESSKKEDTVFESIASYPEKPTLSGSYQGFVAHVENPAHIYLQLVADEDAKNHIEDIIDKIYADEGPGLIKDIKEGMPCCTSLDKVLYRAEVLEVLEKTVMVKFVDYGNIDEKDKSEIQILAPELLNKHPLAYKARLSGAVNSESGWSDETIDKLHEEATNKTLNIEIKSGRELYEVELFHQGQSVNETIIVDLPPEMIVEVKETQTDDNSSEQYESAVEEGSTAGTADTLDEEFAESQVEVDESTIVAPENKGEDTDKDDSEFEDAEDTVTESLQAAKSVSFMIGSKHEIYVSHQKCPSRFWIQTVKQEGELEALQESLMEYYNDKGNREETEKLSPGMLCVTRYSGEEDESWYRACIVSVSDNEVEVQFIDYGDTTTVDVTTVYSIADQFLAAPVYATECILHGVRAKDGQWSEKSKETFEELVKEKKLLAEIIAAECGPGDIHMSYVIRLLDMGIPVAQSLIDSGVAEDSGTPVPRPKALLSDKDELDDSIAASSTEHKQEEAEAEVLDKDETTKKHDKVTIGENVTMTVGSKYQGTAVYIVSPGEFFVQLEQFKTELENLVKEMQEYYSDEQNKTEMTVLDGSSVQDGDIYAAYSPTEEYWYRGLVATKETEDTSEIEKRIKYLDYGNEEVVPLTSLCVLKPEFAVLPAQSMECSYCDIGPRDEDEGCWHPDAADILYEATNEKMLTVDVVSKSNTGVYSVKLLDMGLSVGNRLVAEGLVKRLGPNPDLTLEESCLDYTTVEEVKRQTEETEVASPKFIMPSLTEGSTVEVYVPHIDTPHRLYCQLQESSSELPLFTDKLVDYYNSLRDDQETLVDLWVGKACVAPYSVDNSWYRASITDIHDDQVTVLFVDYGNSETMDRKCLRNINVEFLALPIQTFCCQLFGIEPADGSTSWEEESCSRLNEICMGEEETNEYDSRVFKAELVKIQRDNCDCITMVDIHLHDGENSIEDLLVQGGYAQKAKQPDSSSDLDITKVAEQIVLDTIEESRKIYLKELEFDNSAEISTNRVIRTSSLEMEGYEFQPVEVGTVLDVRYLQGASPDDFCLQLVGDSAKDLETLTSNIQTYCENNQVENTEEEKYAVGQACLVMSAEHTRWCRGKITAINDDKYQVKLVDYNTTETVDLNSITPTTTEFTEMKVPTINCRLAAIIPAEDDQWNQAALKEFDMMCSDVDLTAKIVEKEVDVYKVYLFKPSDLSGLSINHQMVIRQHAEIAKGFEQELENELNREAQADSFLEMSACMSNSFGSLDDSNDVESTDGDVFSHLKYHTGQKLDMMFVTCNDDHLVCQPVESAQALEEMTAKINKCYAEDEPVLDDPQVGQACCVKSSVDDRWHRAEVTSVVGNGMIIKCKAIDTGDSIPASTDRVKLLRQEFLALPAQAVIVYISNLSPFAERSTKIYDFLESTFAGDDGKVHMNVRVDQVVGESTIKASVFMSSGLSFIDELLANDLLPGNTPEGSTAEENTASVTEDEDQDGTQSESEQEELESSVQFKNIPRPELVAGTQYDIKLSAVENPHSLWCRIESAGNSEQMEEIQDIYNKMEMSSQLKIKEGDHCVALNTEENQWCRAKVQSEYEGTYTVLFVDSGSTGTTQQVSPLTEELSQIPYMAVHCSLHNVQPRGADWSDEVTDELSSYLNQSFTMTLMDNPSDSEPVCVNLLFKDREENLRDLIVGKKLVASDSEENQDTES